MKEINYSYPCKEGYYGGKRTLNSNSYIAMHYTGNKKDTAVNNAKYFHTSIDRKASAHFFVDETSIYCSVREDHIAWSVGDAGVGRLKGIVTNTNSISIEMCTSGNYEVSATTEENAIELVKYLMKKYGIPASHVVRHYDVTKKACPSASFRSGDRWANFIAKLNGKTTTSQPTSSETSCNYKVKVNTASGVNCRSTPSTSGSKVKAYANGTTLTITKESNGWGYTGEGWVKLEYTTKVVAATPKPTSSRPLGTYEVTASALKVRTGAGSNYRVKSKKELTADGKKHSNASGYLLKGTRVTVSQWLNGWGKTPSGWLSGEYLKQV